MCFDGAGHAAAGNLALDSEGSGSPAGLMVANTPTTKEGHLLAAQAGVSWGGAAAHACTCMPELGGWMGGCQYGMMVLDDACAAQASKQ